MSTGFFLLAGGLGRRARPLSLAKPKPAFPLNGTPLIQIMLRQLNSLGLSRGFINTHYMADAVHDCVDRERFPGISFLHEEQLSGSMILKEAVSPMGENDLLLVLNGDIFLEIPLAAMQQRLMENESDLLLLVREKTGPGDREYPSLVTRGIQFLGREKTLFPNGGNVTQQPDYMYPGVALFTRAALGAIQHISFFDSIEANPGKLKISILPYTGIWLDIGDPQSYREADRAYKSHSGISDPLLNSLSPNVTISGDSHVTRSIIWENTEILNRSCLDNCIITGNTRINNLHLKNVIQ